MAKKTIEQRLAELDSRRAALKARLSKQDRNNDTRRKVLLGALVLHRLENANDPEFTKRLGDWLRRELPGFLTRDNDKALFADLLGQAPPNTTKNTDGTNVMS
ncbi:MULTISPECIES: mobilization protein [Rhizobium/Agrobacterium group]|uniref:mobilization protein n=1 Tax=Rhizobium/Agrobacterium group TaxID=227290 RepID=UPI000B763D8C|nr:MULTISPECIES: mobilization protein [Rhizobium/Agrobacterium group]MCF1485573.1 mobilization protein [Allorhizobium ampelinum]NSZ46263.1 mobilization protein [Agrobacterium vitis]NTA25359.1 mobilization protein [Allorhizobium ampelinum]OVE97150.1 mobilization protein [Allorhizobium ampelinum]